MIIVTGASGFLGQYCVQELSKMNLPLFLATADKKALEDTRNHYYYLNLKEPESFFALPNTIDTVIHLAAVVPKKNETVLLTEFMDINAIGVKSLIEEVARRGCKRFIYASTQMVIEKPFYLPVDEVHPLVPLSEYGLSKAVGEKYCLFYARSLNIETISLRFAQIYGAGENPGYVLTNFIERARKGLPLIVYGSGKIIRDLLYVKDAVRAILYILHSHAQGIYNIGGGRGVSIKELAEAIAEVFGKGRSRIEYKNIHEGGEDFYMSIEKARTELGFVPQYSLREGLADYKAHMLKVEEKIQ